MKKILIIVLAVLAVIVLAVAGIAIYLWMFLSEPPEQTAKYLPVDTTFYASMNLRPGVGQLNQIRKIVGKFPKRSEVDETLDEVSDSIEEETGIDLLDDVWTWIGSEVSVALVDVESLDVAPEIAVFIQTRNTEAAQETVDLFIKQMESEGMEFKVGKAHGYTTLGHSDKDGGVHIALTDDLLVYASTDRLLDNTLERIKNPTTSLYDNPDFIKAREQAPDRVAFMYSRLNGFANLIEEELFNAEPSLQSTSLWDKYNSTNYVISGSMGFEDESVRLNFSIYGDLDEGSENSMSAKNILPSDTVMYFSFPGLSSIWTQFKEELTASGDTFEIDSVLSTIEDETGVSIDDDVFGWMTGEFALTWLAGDIGSLEGDELPIIDAAVLFEGNNKATVNKSMAKIRNVMENDLEIPFENIDVNGTETSVIDISEITETDAYEPWFNVNDKTLMIGTTRGALQRVSDVTNGDSKSLAESDTFKKAMDSSLDNPQFLMYLNMSLAREMIETALPDDVISTYRKDVEQWLRPIGAITITGTNKSDVAQARISVTFTGE